MRFRNSECRRSYKWHKSFQFSLWDSLRGPLPPVFVMGNFQFSLWDSHQFLISHHFCLHQLSILFMRFTFMTQTAGTLKLRTFNSLYEIRYYTFIALNNYFIASFNSLYEILIWKFWFSIKEFYTFNSLYEILYMGAQGIVCLTDLSILFMRFIKKYNQNKLAKYPFNSLYEILLSLV